jgi:hypothetical protein
LHYLKKINYDKITFYYSISIWMFSKCTMEIRHKTRELHSIFDRAFLKEEVYEEQYRKHFKTQYNGKLTKRYQKLMNKINLSDRFPADIIQRLLMSK